MDDKEAEDHAHNIATESADMGDDGLAESVDGDCVECDKPAIRRDPETGDLLCNEHSKERFRERHG